MWYALRLAASALLLILLLTNGMIAMGDQALPTLPTDVELVAAGLSAGVIHGWHSNLLLKHKGVLYACATVDDPASKNEWKRSGLFFRREADGKWTQVGATPESPYIWYAGRDGRFWMVAPSSYGDAQVFRMERPLDFGSFKELYNGTCSYEGASISPEGNFLILHAESQQMQAFVPNAMIGAFYDHQDGKWYKSRIVTPEGRYGYVGIILKGRKAIAVLNSAIQDRKANPNPPHYSWRHVRLARCDDLTKGEWTNKGFLMPEFGNTALNDLMVGPDGNIYLADSHNSGPTYEAMSKEPTLHYITRIKEDLSTEVFATGINAGATRILVSRAGAWYVVGRPGAGGNLHLWAVDPDNGFKPTKEWELPGTDVLQAYVIHTLRPARFGGETDGDTIHLMTAKYLPVEKDQPAKAELWHASFRLPG
jgi:hypothetical protein